MKLRRRRNRRIIGSAPFPIAVAGTGASPSIIPWVVQEVIHHFYGHLKFFFFGGFCVFPHPSARRSSRSLTTAIHHLPPPAPRDTHISNLPISRCVFVFAPRRAIPSGVWSLDHVYHENMFGMFKKVNTKEKVLGWYHTGPKLKPSDLSIHEL